MKKLIAITLMLLMAPIMARAVSVQTSWAHWSENVDSSKIYVYSWDGQTILDSQATSERTSSLIDYDTTLSLNLDDSSYQVTILLFYPGANGGSRWSKLYVAGDVATQNVNLIEIGGVAQSATDLKDFADDGYNPATNALLLVTTATNVTTVNGLAANVITAASINAAALNGKGDWNIGKTGYALTSADWENVWFDIDTINIDSSILGKWFTKASWNAGTRTLTTADWSTHSAADVWTAGTRTLTTADWNVGKTGYSLTTADKDDIVDRTWNEDSTGHYTSPQMAFVASQTSASSMTEQTIAREVWTIKSADDTTYAANTMGLNSKEWDATVASSLDSGIVSRIVGRKVWGIPAGSGSDSTALALRNVDIEMISGDAAAADNLELDYDGTGYDKGNSTIGTATAVTDMVTANVTQLSGSAVAADALEETFDNDAISSGSIEADIIGNITGNLSGSVGSVTAQVSANMTAISGDALAADSLEFGLDGGAETNRERLFIVALQSTSDSLLDSLGFYPDIVGANLVRNPGFERDSVGGSAPEFWTQGDGTHTNDLTQTSSFDGRWEFRIVPAVNETSFVYQVIGNLPDGDYLFSGRGASDVTSDAMVVIDNAVPTTTSEHIDSMTFAASDGQVAKIITLSNSPNNNIFIGLRVNITVAAFGDFDDIRLIYLGFDTSAYKSKGDTSLWTASTDSVLVANRAEMAAEHSDSTWSADTSSVAAINSATMAGMVKDTGQYQGAAGSLTKEAVAREVWTIAGADDTTYAAGTMGLEAVGWDAAGGGGASKEEIAREVWTIKSADDSTYAAETMGLNSKGWDATGAGGGGAITLVIGASDTLNTGATAADTIFDTLVSKVEITMRDIAGNIHGSVQTTNSAGYTTWGVTSGESLTVQIVGVIWNGHIWTSTLDTIVGPASIDTFACCGVNANDSILMGYDFPIGPPSSPALCRVYGFVRKGNDSIVNRAVVEITLRERNIIDTSTNILIVPETMRTFTDTDGYWFIDLVRTKNFNKDAPYYLDIRKGSRRYFTGKEFRVPDTSQYQVSW